VYPGQISTIRGREERLRVDPKKDKYAALLQVRDTALGAAKLIEDQMIVGSRLDEQDRSAILIDPRAQNSQSGSDVDTVTPREVKELARKVREVLSRSPGSQAAFQLFSEMFRRFRIVTYRDITREQHAQIVAWLQEFEA
jgi:hypothetical protein